MNFERKQQLLFVLWTIGLLAVGSGLLWVGLHLALPVIGGVGAVFIVLAAVAAAQVVA